jgi:hypothetical protein
MSHPRPQLQLPRMRGKLHSQFHWTRPLRHFDIMFPANSTCSVSVQCVSSFKQFSRMKSAIITKTTYSFMCAFFLVSVSLYAFLYFFLAASVV